MALNESVVAKSVAERLADLKAAIEVGKSERIKAQTNLENFNRQKNEILRQLSELNVAPEGLDDEISRLDREVEEALAKAEELLRG